MLERVTQKALFNAAEAGYEQAARADVARVDPLLRRRVDKQLRKAINDGIERTGPVDDVIDEQHQLRVAYLLLCGTLGDLDPRSKEKVGEAFAKAAENAPEKAPRLWFFTPLVLLLVLGGGAFAGYHLFGPSPEQKLRRSTLGRAMSTDLGKWVVSLDRFRRARDSFSGVDGKLNKLEERKKTLLESTNEALGDDGKKKLSAILDAGEKVDGSGRPEGEDPKNPDPDHVPDDEKNLFAAVRGFNELLASEGHPVLLDARTERSTIRGGGDLGGIVPFRDVIVVSYYVERLGTLQYRGKDTPLTLGKRLDNLNVSIVSDAYDTEALGGILVSLDLAEQALTRGLMGALADGTPWEIVPEKYASSLEEGDVMLNTAGRVLREEMLEKAGVEQEVATKIADLLAQREDAINKVADHGGTATSKLLLDEESIEKLEHFREENLDVFQVLELNEKLATYEDAFKSILLIFADASTVRGGVYLSEDEKAEPPKSLVDALVDLPGEYGGAAQARRLMLANLAAIGHSEAISRTLLTLVVRDLLIRSIPLPHDRAVLTEIAKELGVEASDPWMTKGRFTKRFPAFYNALMEKSSKEVSAAARAAFERTSDEKMPTLTWK